MDSTGQGHRDLEVSVIVPTFNRRGPLARLLGGLERQHAAGIRFEVVVVDDGSDDGTAGFLATLRTPYPLRVIHQSRQGPAAARNAAIAAATAAVLLFLDDDVVPQDGLFEGHLAIHARDPLAAVAGRMAAPPGRTFAPWLDWEASMLERSYARILAGNGGPGWWLFYTANASVRREHVLAVGGFDDRFVRVEDSDLAYRLFARGLRFHFVPDAVVDHEPDRTFETWLRNAFVSGLHRVLMERRIGAAGAGNIQDDWHRRRSSTRLLTRWCVGHRGRTRLVVAAARRAMMTPFAPRQIRLALCSALYNVRFWSGIAEATGLGSSLWSEFIDQPAASMPGPLPQRM